MIILLRLRLLGQGEGWLGGHHHVVHGVEILSWQLIIRVYMVDAAQSCDLCNVFVEVCIRAVDELLQGAHVELCPVRKRSLVHNLRARSRDVSRCLVGLPSLSRLDLRVHLQGCEHLVAHSVVVECE